MFYVGVEGIKLVEYFEDYDIAILQNPNSPFLMFEFKIYHSNVRFNVNKA